MEEVNSLDLVKNRVKSSQLPEIPLKKYLIVTDFSLLAILLRVCTVSKTNLDLMTMAFRAFMAAWESQ